MTDAAKRRGPAPGTPNAYAREKAAEKRAADKARAKPLSADTKVFQNLILAGVVVIAGSAFAISYASLARVASWTGWDDWQTLLLPILLDLGIVVFTFLSFIRMERGETIWPTFLLAEALTVLSSVANVLETIDQSDRVGSQLVVACVIAALPPLILAGSSYLAGRTVFKRVEAKNG